MAPADSARADEQGHGRLVSVDALPSQRAFANTGKAIGFSYLTRNQRGALAPATGAIYLPKGETPPGGWPVIVWAHGTVGISSGCAPSKSGQGERNGKYFSRVLAEGFAVIAPTTRAWAPAANSATTTATSRALPSSTPCPPRTRRRRTSAATGP